METATAVVGSLLPKLQACLPKHEGDRRDVELLCHELASIHAALLRAQAPPHEAARAWAREARELAYDVDDALLVTPAARGEEEDGGRGHGAPGAPFGDLKGLLQRATDLSRAPPRTTDDAPPAGIDHPLPPPPPPGEAVVVGVGDARDGLVRRLRVRDEAGGVDGAALDRQVKVVSAVGSAGLGKTTIARATYGALKSQFVCAAFVSVGLDPDVAEVLESMLRQLGFTGEADADERGDERKLIRQLSGFLQNKRYFIVLDDLWDKPSWEKIRCALVDNNRTSRIVVTTRNLDVAEEIGTPYELKPLSAENSKLLFFRTIFGHEDKCCPHDGFTEVADKILRKCGGVPLAIITLAKLLASKMGDKREWHKVYESIGIGLENTPDVENMRRVLSPGYCNLPPHLRACLLYTSIFPEDYEIRQDRLVWRWIAEGFVQSGNKQGESLFEHGNSYFDDLVNRCMFKLLDIDYAEDGGRDEYCCSVSFPVMDFISYVSSQENFVTVLDGEQRALPSGMPVRRVSVRGGSKAEDSASLATMTTPHLRSLSVFCPALAESIDLNRCEFLRVLDLEGCDLSESHLLQKHLGSLIHLRYLGLRETRTAVIPEEIGNLRFLQTLDLEGNDKLDELPASVTQLAELMCLRVYWQTRLPSGMGNLTALEELSDASTHDSPDLVKELGRLTKLRVLRITLRKPSRSLEEVLVESLRNLSKIQTLDVYVAGGVAGDETHRLDMVREAWTPPRCLREFQSRAMNSYRSALQLLPAWVDAPTTPHLAVVVVQVLELRQQDVDALGRLPALRVLRLDPYSNGEPLAVSGGAFPRLAECMFQDSDLAPVFRPGAAPRLRRLEFCFRVRHTVDRCGGSFDFGLENLGFLEEATVYMACQEAWEVETEAAEEALRRAADGHPNRAAFDVITFGEELMCFDDDDQ